MMPAPCIHRELATIVSSRDTRIRDRGFSYIRMILIYPSLISIVFGNLFENAVDAFLGGADGRIICPQEASGDA